VRTIPESYIWNLTRDVARSGWAIDTSFVRMIKDGVPGLSRYIDVYVRTGDDWKVVSAQITGPSTGA
jgi:hypothetical protein